MDKINFILDNIPENYNKEQNSNIYKILSSIGSELDKFVEYTEEVKNSKFVDYAKGIDLDKIAHILNLKRFNNENDFNFRSRIKSKIPSFIGGGTISSIKQVINNYLGIEPVIIEHYKPGEGHALFDNGVLNGLNVTSINSTNVTINPGSAYAQGGRLYVSSPITKIISAGDNYLKYNIFPIGTKLTSNFAGKIAGSNIVNGNRAGYYEAATLITPAQGGMELVNDNYQWNSYNCLYTLDNQKQITPTSATNGLKAQTLFSFDIIKALTDKYGSSIWQGKTLLAEKIAIAENIVVGMTFNWWGYGSGPNGTKAYTKAWADGASTWADWGIIHTQGTVQKLTMPITLPSDIGSIIDANGFGHFMAHSDASNGIAPSAINTDYVELELELKENSFLTVETNSAIGSNQVLLAKANGTTITDMRNILNPEENYITNTASITIQIPFSFSVSNISLEDVKDILRNTKAAGIALLIKIMETYNDYIDVTDSVNNYFLMGYSGIGGNNTLGGT